MWTHTQSPNSRPNVGALGTKAIESPPVSATVEESPRARSGLARFPTVVLSHAVTDFLSFVIIPLMSLLEDRAHFSHAQGAILLGVGSISSGLIQPIAALVSDRFA